MIRVEKNRVTFDGGKEEIAAELAIMINTISKTLGSDTVKMAYDVLLEMEKKGTSIKKMEKEDADPGKELKEMHQTDAKKMRDRIAADFFKIVKGGKDSWQAAVREKN